MTPHPLDRDYSDPQSEDNQDQLASDSQYNHSPALLAFSLKGLLVAAVLVVLSSVLVSNLNYQDPGFPLANLFNRLSMLLALLAFVGILLSYQMNNVKQILKRWHRKPPEQKRPAAGQSSTTSSKSPLLLLGIFIMLLVIVWALAFAGQLSATIRNVLELNIITIPGLLITMIVWNRGTMRAFAIGTLSTFVFTSFRNLSLGGFVMNQDYFWTIGLTGTIVLIGGLIPALYVLLLSKYRPPS